MNPGIENYEEYLKYRGILKKIRTLKFLDGLDIYDDKNLESLRNRKGNITLSTDQKAAKRNLFDFGDENFNNKAKYNVDNNITNNENNNFNIGNTSNYMEQSNKIDENDIMNIIKSKKRQSTITYSQRMLKKADNLTKFNRKNHSEGNKHITNNDL
jgi:hypothetical protein